MRKLQLLLGLVLALVAAGGVFVVGRMSQPIYHEVIVAKQEIPAYTELSREMFKKDLQSASPEVIREYVLVDEYYAMESEGAIVAVENLHPGQPLLRTQVASGAEAQGLSRLSVALDDPDRVIMAVPVEEETLPSLVPGDVVALFFSAGSISAQGLVTQTVEGGQEEDGAGVVVTATRRIDLSQREPVTTTTTLLMPLSKWVSNGVVYHVNREMRENPNYGAPGMENEPRYVEGDITSLDIVVDRQQAEELVFALAHGQIQVAVLPAVARNAVEAGDFPVSAGWTWTDWELAFFADRAESNGGGHE